MLRILVSLVMAALWTASVSAQQPAASSRLDDILKRGTLRNIIKEAGLTVEEFTALL